VALLAVGCYHGRPPIKPDELVHTATNPEFADAREDLVDIVVLSARPPEGNVKGSGPHLRRFRRLVYEGLIDKGYSPLQLSYIDRQIAGEKLEKRSDPDFNLTRFDEDAVMVLSVNEWNKRYIHEYGGILVSASLALIRSDPKANLWKHEIRHRLYEIPDQVDESSLSIDEQVVDLVVKDLLKKLPPRA
jgi:hypothetical protein